MAVTSTEGSYTDFGVSTARQSFTVPQDGIYKLEVWGFQGSSVSSSYGTGTGGYGGYSYGYKQLTKGTILYIDCGSNSSPGGAQSSVNYNNTDSIGRLHTGSNYLGAGGKKTQILSGSTVLIVAGGGGGGQSGYDSFGSSDCGKNNGGAGGGASGGNGTHTGYGGDQNYGDYARGGSQSAAGADANKSRFQITMEANGGGAGDGYYKGGNGCISTIRGCGSSGAGGSGYIGGVPSFAYNGVTYAPSTTAGSRAGNGAARITYVKAMGIYNLYHNGTQVKAAKYGSTNLTEVKYGSTTVFKV